MGVFKGPAPRKDIPFGPILEPLFTQLENELTWLSAKWLEYCRLFAKSKERVDLLNEMADFSFGIVQETMWENIILHIARLTDPATMGKYSNMTMLRLRDVSYCTQEVTDQVMTLVTDAEEKAKFSREWRNKHLAHIDVDANLGRTVHLLAPITRQQIDNSLKSFMTLLNEISRAYKETEIGFDNFISYNDGDTLVYHLEKARLYEAQRQERLNAGKPLPEDFQGGKL